MKGIGEILVLMLMLPFFAEAQIEYMCIDPSEDDEPVYDMRVEKKQHIQEDIMDYRRT